MTGFTIRDHIGNEDVAPGVDFDSVSEMIVHNLMLMHAKNPDVYEDAQMLALIGFAKARNIRKRSADSHIWVYNDSDKDPKERGYARLWNNGEDWQVREMYVDFESRGEGIGRNLMQLVEGRAVKLTDRLVAESLMYESTQRFYGNNGFEVVEEIQGKSGGIEIPLMKMEKQL